MPASVIQIRRPVNGRESYAPPRDLVRRITAAGGTNAFGGPRFQVVWGWSRLDWAGGKWECDGSMRTELRRIPKYPYSQLNRWIIEAWVPPEKYGDPTTWPSDELGPFPSRGDYEHVLTLQDKNGGFVALTSQVCDYVVRLVEASRVITYGERRAHLLEKEAKKDREWDRDADDILTDHPRFWKRPHVAYTSQGSPHSFGNG